MGFLSDMFSPSSILSGGITFANDNIMKAAGTKPDNTFFAVNDALKNGPLETSFNQGSPASFSQLEGDRANRLGADKTGTARGIGDIAALVGMLYGGAAMAGGSAAGSSGASSGAAPAAGSGFVNPASSNAAFSAANTGSSNMWPQLIKSGMQMMGGQSGSGGGMMGGLMGMGQQQQKPQFDTNAWVQKQKDEQNKMLMAQNMQASKPPEYNDYG